MSQILERAKVPQIIEATFAELLVLKESGVLAIYANVMLGYHLGKISGIADCERKFGEFLAAPDISPEDRADIEAMLRLAEIRRFTLQGQMNDELIARTEREIQPGSIWYGEAMFCIAQFLFRAYPESFRQETSDRYAKAETAYLAAGIRRKALVAMVNRIGTDPKVQHLKLASLFSAARIGRQSNMQPVAGAAFFNIATVYYNHGLLNVALRFANRAVACNRTIYGSREFHYSNILRARILSDQGRKTEAQLILDEAKLAGIPEVEKLILLVDSAARKGQTIPPPEEFEPAWRPLREEVSEMQARGDESHIYKLTPLEGRVIELLAESPLAKVDLMERLYGKRISAASAEGRVKNLLHRIREKSPDLIALVNGKYRLTMEVPAMAIRN